MTASDAQPNKQFGWAVAVEGDVAIIGAKDKDSASSNAGATNAGAVYFFEKFILSSPQIATNALVFP